MSLIQIFPLLATICLITVGATATPTESSVSVEETTISNTENDVAAEFPTPKPFLNEPPSEPNSAEKELQDSISIIPYVPPNFDIKFVTEVTGVMRDGEDDTVGRYVGRANCECGRPGERRIVGGEPAKINEYPWVASLLRKNWLGITSLTAYCGAALINSRYIVTASHCVDGMSARGIVVNLHEEDQFSASETPAGNKRFDVEKIIMHPNYNRRNIDNDIALLKLAKPVDLGSIFVPVCLPAGNNHSFAGETSTVLGWGATSEGGAVSGTLRKVDVPVLTNEDCNTNTKYNGKITDNMLCAGYLEEGGKDSCQGDSGGFLGIPNGGRWTQIGVVSWGYGCARPKSPGVYTRVGRFSEWILQNSKGADWCHK